MKEDDVQITQEIVVRTAEHEHVLSFNSDWMAEAFADWWEVEGRLIFVDWATANEDEY